MGKLEVVVMKEQPGNLRRPHLTISLRFSLSLFYMRSTFCDAGGVDADADVDSGDGGVFVMCPRSKILGSLHKGHLRSNCIESGHFQSRVRLSTADPDRTATTFLSLHACANKCQ